MWGDLLNWIMFDKEVYEKMSRKYLRRWAVISLLPVMLIFIIFLIVPAIANVWLSFTNFSGSITVPFHSVGFDNYKRIFTSMSGQMWNLIKVTLIYAFSVTIIQNILAVVTAVVVNMKLRGRNFYRAVMFLPSILSVVVIGLAWNLILDPIYGPVNGLLQALGGNSALLGDPHAALPLVIFVTIWSCFGYAMLLYLAGLQKVPQELYESCMVEGGNSWAKFRHVTVPFIRPVITINILLSIIGTLNSYAIIFVLTSGGPAQITTTLGLYIFKNLSSSNTAGLSQGFVAACSIVLYLIVLFFVIISRYFLSRKEDVADA